MDHRIRTDVPEVRLLVADEVALAFEIDVGETANIAVLERDHSLHRIGDLFHRRTLRAGGEGGRGKIHFRHAPGSRHVGGYGGVGTVDRGVRREVRHDDDTVRIKVRHKASEIGELVVGVDDDSRPAVGTGGVDRIVGREGGRVAREGDGDITGVTEAGVGSGGEDDVDIGEQGRERLLVGDLLEVGHDDDLVHSLALEIVDDRLHLAGEQGHVVDLAAVAGETLHLDIAGG